MAAASNEQRLAAHLGVPFARPGQCKAPLSFRLLPEGGMVVISADGRKLWFTLDEVNIARCELGLPEVKPPHIPREKKEENDRQPDITSRPPPGNRDGKSEMIVLPPELKHLEQKAHVKIRRP
jgi:hypothetical protein